uniref:Uncharacterized protein n=1 Tax=viral metagenome TaxID=1070528 RepID=A0A6H1ZKW0_9ZZZZ
MPEKDKEKLEGKEGEDEEEEEEPDEPKVVSQEDFNKLRSVLDGQVASERREKERVQAELKTLRDQFSVFEKGLLKGGGFESEDEEEEEEEDLFDDSSKKKKKRAGKKVAARMRVLEEKNRQLEENAASAEARGIMQERISDLLGSTKVSKNDPELDWARDVQDPEEGFRRLMVSAIAIAEGRKDERATAKAKALTKKDKIEKGGPKEPSSSFLARWKEGRATDKEIEEVLHKAKRRKTDKEGGGSELDMGEITS